MKQIKKTATLMEEIMRGEFNSQIQPLTPQLLKSEIEEILNSRLVDEYQAYYFYLNASNWCNGKGYTKAGSFFDQESNHELEHAKKLQGYLVDWNLEPKLPKVETQFKFNSLVEIINGAYKLEYELLQKYSNDSRNCLIKDINTFNFLQQFLTIQNDSVKEFSDLLNVLMLIDHTDKYQLLYFENNYF